MLSESASGDVIKFQHFVSRQSPRQLALLSFVLSFSGG